ncbi:universal stress protein [Microbacterium sp. STN6]|uniref:universal stress protein n=1 Tax=Microbacterium sp. STN6 TaxID=2995588 RepID=UPI002260EB40|nr:universal stress protein [Microbacterium sp. STN6]MCX7520877.1 universal stress protein [Microbacterium sp. STN6]
MVAAESAGGTDAPTPAPQIIVGVVRGQSETVLHAAVSFARRFGASLICASVDAMRYAVEEHPDGTVTSLPVDPDPVEQEDGAFDPQIERTLHELLDGSGVQWSTRALAGDPARALARLADVVDAEAILVGTRHGGLRSGLQEFFGGSVAVHLAHRQHLPVIVIPVNPVGGEEALPWEDQPWEGAS